MEAVGLPALWAMPNSLGASSIMHGHTGTALPSFLLSNRLKRFPITEGGGLRRCSWVHGLPLPSVVTLATFLLLHAIP